MRLQADIRFQEQLKRSSKYLSWTTLLISITVLAGWQLDIDLLKRPFPDVAAMNPMAAFLFLLSALSFLFITRTNKDRPVFFTGRFFAFIIFLFGVFSFISTLSKPDFSWEYFLYYPVARKEELSQMPMSIAPVASVGFILTGLSLLFIDKKIGNRLPSQYIVLIIHLIAAFSIISYLYHVKSFYGNRFYNPMAIYTAICFILISLVILFANPSQGIMKQFTSIHTGSSSARILIPTAVMIPFGFGLLLHYGSWLQLYSPEFSIVLFVLVIVMIFFIAIWYNTILLNKRDLQKTKTEAALRDSQEQIQAIFRSAPDAVIVTNENGRVLQWNKQAELLFGWTLEEAWYKNLGDVIIASPHLSDQRTKLEHFIGAGKKNTPDIVLELKSFKKNGSAIDISISISSSLVNEKYLFVAFIRDITEKKKAEEQLKHFNKVLSEQVTEKTAELTGIFERITDAFISLDKNFCYTYANKRTGELIHRDPSTLIGKCVWDIFPDAVGSGTYNAFQKAMKEQCYVVSEDYYEPLDLWQENHIYPSPDGLSVFIRDISQKKRAEEEIRQRAIQLHTISNSLPGIMTYQLIREQNGKMCFTYVSESVMSLTGCKPQEIIADPDILYNVVHEEDRIKFKKAEDRSYQTLSLLDIVVRAIDHSGDTKWLHIRSFPRKLANGNIAWDGVHMDITETMVKEKQVSEKEAQLRLFVENSPAAIAMLDKDLNYMIVSNRWKKDYDLGDCDIVGKNHYEIFPELPEELKLVYKRCLAGAIEKKEEDVFIRKNGKKEWIRWEVHPWYTISGEVDGIILLTEVITDKKEIQIALKEKEEKYRTLVEQASDGIFIADSTYKYIEVNDAGCKMLGYTKEELLNHRIQDVVVLSPDDSPLRFKELQEGKSILHERILCHKNGSYVYVEISGKQLADGTLLAFARDITERKKAGEKLRSSNERFEMIARTTHDAIWEWNLETNELWANTRHQELYGLTEKDPVPLIDEWKRRIHPDDLELTSSAQENVLRSDQNAWISEYRFLTGENKYSDIYDRTYVVRNEQGKAIRLMGSMMDITERKKAENNVRKSEQQYRLLIEQASDAIMILDLDGNFSDVNTSMCEMFGYAKEELLQLNIRDIIDPAQLADQPLRFEELRKGKHVFSHRRMLHKNGTIIDVEANIKMMPDERIVAIVRDITERKKGEELLKESEERYRTLIEQASDAILIYSLDDGRLLDYNNAFMTTTGYTKEDTASLTLTDLLFKEDLADRPISFNKIKSGMAVHDERRAKRKDGSPVPVELNSKLMPDGNVMVIARDVTERKKAEQQLIESENRLRTILNTEPECIKLLGPEGELIDMNPAGLEMIEVDNLEQVKGQRVEAIIDPQYREAFNKLTNDVFKGKPGKLEFEITGLKGTKRWMSTHAVPLKDTSGKIISLLSVTRDISERKKAEEEMLLANERFNLIARATNDFVWDSHIADNKVWWNDNYYLQLGWIKGVEAPGKNSWEDHIFPKDKKRVIERLDYILNETNESAWTDEYNFCKADGTYITVYDRGYIMRDKDGKAYRMIGAMTDISELKKTESLLKKSYENIRRLASHLERIREEERIAIAREIHDELGQQLTVLKMDVSWLNKNLSITGEKQITRMNELLETIDNTIKTVRRISSELRPSVLDDLGLIAALEWLLKDFEKRSGVKTRLISGIEKLDLDINAKTALFRVFQESLTNVARHAKASEVIASLNKSGDNLLITIKDNGKGFVLSAIESKKTLGILGIKERIAIIEGTYNIDSSPGEGTTIEIEVPVSSETEPK